jgi:hypothetical protein
MRKEAYKNCTVFVRFYRFLYSEISIKGLVREREAVLGASSPERGAQIRIQVKMFKHFPSDNAAINRDITGQVVIHF